MSGLARRFAQGLARGFAQGFARRPGGASGAVLPLLGTERGTPRATADGGSGAASIPTAARRRPAHVWAGVLGSVIPSLFPAADSYAQSRIDRLFSSPEQRIELDRLRDEPDSGEEAEPVVDRTGPEFRPEPAGGRPASAVTLDGVVLRSGGYRVAWVNGVETAVGAAPPAGVRVDAEQVPDGRLRIRWPEGGTSAALKPGQTIDAEGRMRDAYER